MKKNRYAVGLCLVCPLLLIGMVSAALFGCSEKPEPAKVSQEIAGEKEMAAEPPKVVESEPGETLSDGGGTESDIPSEQAEPEQAEPEQAEPEQAEPEQAESEQAESEQAEPEQAESEQAEPDTREDIADVIRMENRAYEEHTRAVVLFTHRKHMDAYAKTFPEFYKDGCGTCHHDENNEPLVLEAGDAVQGCIECHKQPGERPKGTDAPELSKEERLAYHAEALHYNCKDCHSDVNKKTGTKAAPTTCTKCHLKQT